MQLLITGGAGFIGTHLCTRLRTNPNHSIRVLDDGSGLPNGISSEVDGVEYVGGSVLDRGLLSDVTQDVDCIVHLAGVTHPAIAYSNPAETFEINALGSAYVAEAAMSANNAHLICMSSGSVYGANPATPTHEGLTPLPQEPYAASKLAGEAMVMSYRHAYGLPVLLLRPFEVFGTGQPTDHRSGAQVAGLISAASNKQPARIPNDGRTASDLLAVNDLVTYLVRAIERKISYSAPINVASGIRVTTLELVALISSLLAEPMMLEHVLATPNADQNRMADTTRLRAVFGELYRTPMIEVLSEMLIAERAKQLVPNA